MGRETWAIGQVRQEHCKRDHRITETVGAQSPGRYRQMRPSFIFPSSEIIC